MTDFRIRVIIDPTPAVAGTKKVEGQLLRTKGAADKLRTTLFRTFAAVGLVAGIGGSIRLLADYSQAMSTVEAVTGATAEQFAELDARAQDLGRNTRFTATQAAEGMVLLARAGFTAEESLVAVEGTLKLAQAGGLGLAEAANVAANSLRGFRLDVDQTNRVVDVLALAANSANTNVGQLGEGLKFVAPIAAGLGVSLETTTAAVSKLSDSGLQATLAGTGLRRVLSELESPSQKTSAILRDLGLSTDDVRVSQVGLVSALTSLKEAGLDTGQALEIFGDRGGPAFEVLSSNIPAVQELADELENAAGTADRVAEVMDDNLNGALLRALSAFQGLLLAAGNSGAFTALESIFNGLAAAFNFLTDNIEATGTALTVLAVGFALTKVGFLTNTTVAIGATAAYIANQGAAGTLALVHTGLGVAALNAAAGLKAAAIAAAANPFTVLVVGAAAAFVAVSKLIEGIREYEEALKIADAGELGGLTEFGRAGAIIAQAERQIAAYEERLKSGNITQEQFELVTRSLTEKIARYKEEQEKAAAATDKSKQAAVELAEAETRLNLGYERSIQGLKEEARLLGLNAREREVQAGLLQEIAAIQEEGGPELIGKQIEELEAALRRNQALKDEADALDSIRGPQEEFITRLETLTRLQDQGRITAEEFDKAVQDLAQSSTDLDLNALQLPEGLDTSLDLSSQIEQIQNLVNAEQERVRVEAVRAQLLRDVLGPEQELTEQARILNDLLNEGAISNEQYAAKLAEINEQLNPLTEEQRRLAEVLDSIRGPQEEQAQRLADLDTLYAQGLITLQEYSAEMAKLQGLEQDLGTSFGDGISSGLDKVAQKMQDIASLSEAVLVNAFNSAEDALVEFATTGQFSFKDFASSILKDIARVIARLLILQAVQGIAGGLGFSLPTGSAGVVGNASGGPFEANQSMIVGEKGPELVRFGQGGTVTPADQTRQALAATGSGSGGAASVNVAPPEVKVQVVNVQSPEEARSAMDTSEGGKIIINQIRANKSAFKRELGIS